MEIKAELNTELLAADGFTQGAEKPKNGLTPVLAVFRGCMGNYFVMAAYYFKKGEMPSPEGGFLPEGWYEITVMTQMCYPIGLEAEMWKPIINPNKF